MGDRRSLDPMKAIQSFTVRPNLPEPLQRLDALASNLRWSWDAPTRELFRTLDPDTWERTAHDPAILLGLVPPARLAALATDADFLRHLDEVVDAHDRYLHEDRWFQHRDSPLRTVAYFSPEFGITEALPQYSGGLGILAGDHLKASSDLGVPIVGVGLFYRHGYFRQSVSLDGWQQERFPDQDPHALALTYTDVQITLELGGEPCHVGIWRADVGRTPLYLLDTDLDQNSPAIREITDRLYGGDTEHRLQQEIVLGMGGIRALAALGIEAQVFHSNEGHAGFLGLERIRDLVTTKSLSFAEAVEAVRPGCVFTTHTPVPAGIDRFSRDLMVKYFSSLASQCRISIDELLALGHRDETPPDDRFNMAVMGLRLAGRANAVAKLHGAVSRQMFASLWPQVPTDEVPIGSVTNGVHAPSWVSGDIARLLHDQVHPIWDGASAEDWKRAADIDDESLWTARNEGRSRLVGFVRQRLRASLERRGLSASDAAWADTVLDPDALTIGFARRFATYKRANLLLSQRDRIQALLASTDRPVQFVFAGKAHPADEPGKGLIQEIVKFGLEPQNRRRFIFLDDYDIAIARAMYHGCDVWLNTPRRPLEACGTSGMKAALNGALNCSILDGWWDESFDGSNGWAISSVDTEIELSKRDRIEADSLFDLLEHQIVPLFYERQDHMARGWMRRVKHNFVTLGPQVTASRMVRDYVTDLYEPAAIAGDRAFADDLAASRELAAWKARVRQQWGGVKVVWVEADNGPTTLGATRNVTAAVAIDGLAPGDLTVQLLHGPVGPTDELTAAGTVDMVDTGSVDGLHHFRAAFPARSAGRYGFNVRVLPHHDAMVTPLELGVISWAH
jgi:glycogen phosphorylase